jgi:hypothetical protein
MSDYPTRCARIADAMARDNCPRKHSPLEWTGRYEQMWAIELLARLHGEPGIRCPDMTGTAYAESWYALRKHNERDSRE